MADEIAQTEAPVEETPQESTTETQTGSEAVQTPETESGKPDLTVALRQEREAKRALEARLSDPNFIYEQARKLGLTAEEAEAMAEETEAPAAQAPPSGMTYADYEYYKSLDKSKEKYPSLATDPEDQVAVTALMRNFNLSPEAAADKYYGKMNKVAETARAEGAKEKETTITEKERAQSVTSTVSTNADAVEMEDLVRQSRDQRNPRMAEKAMLEILKRKERAKGR
jgi:hypothetical protein